MYLRLLEFQKLDSRVEKVKVEKQRKKTWRNINKLLYRYFLYIPKIIRKEVIN